MVFAFGFYFGIYSINLSSPYFMALYVLIASRVAFGIEKTNEIAKRLVL